MPDDRLAELLGAYALDACDPDETAAIEELLRRRPDLAAEAARLTAAAAWLGATEALEPPARLRDAVFAAADVPRYEDAAGLYAAEARRLADELERLDEAHFGTVTPNGLTAWDLVVHLAAQESLLAQAVGRPVDDLTVNDVDDRTAVLVERYRDRALSEVLDHWRRAVDEVEAWSTDSASATATVEWLGVSMAAADALTARAFENWLHRDDLRRVRGQRSDPPDAPGLHVMASLSMRLLPDALVATGRTAPGGIADVVLTGAGGGRWRVRLDPRTASTGEQPVVTLRASTLDWCLLVGERLDPEAFRREVRGAADVADDLVAAAPAFATL